MERNFPHKKIDDFTRVISPIVLIRNGVLYVVIPLYIYVCMLYKIYENNTISYNSLFRNNASIVQQTYSNTESYDTTIPS